MSRIAVAALLLCLATGTAFAQNPNAGSGSPVGAPTGPSVVPDASGQMVTTPSGNVSGMKNGTLSVKKVLHRRHRSASSKSMAHETSGSVAKGAGAGTGN